MPATPDSTPALRRLLDLPRPLLVAALATAVAGLAAGVFGALELLAISRDRLALGVGVSVVLLGYGAALLGIGHALSRRRRWSRGPAMAAAIIHLPVAWSYRGDAPWVTAGLGLLAIVTLIGLFAPSTTAVLTAQSGSAADSDRESDSDDRSAGTA